MGKSIKRYFKTVHALGIIVISALCFVVYKMTPAMEPTENRSSYAAVSGLGSLLYVGTALWTGDSVRIAAIKPRGDTENIYCFLWFSSDLDSKPTTINSVVRDMQSYTQKTTNAYIKCPYKLNSGVKSAPLYVGLGCNYTASSKCTMITQVENRDVDLHKINEKRVLSGSERKSKRFVGQTDRDRIVEFTVCIPPMFDYNDAAQLVEKLEMVRLLGAKRVVLYKKNAGSSIDAVLKFYTQEWREGKGQFKVIVLPWELPPIDVHYYNQIAAIDDCLYRYGWLSQYIVFDDLDELMIPLRHENWSQLIAERERLKPGHAAFLFRASVMHKDHFSPAEGFQADALVYRSSILSFTQRDTLIHNPSDKGKLIVNPRKVETLEVHKVFEANGATDVIPVDLGILYHYRWPLERCRPEVEDTKVVSKFGSLLLTRLKYVWSRLKHVSFEAKFPVLPLNKTTCDTSSTI